MAQEIAHTFVRLIFTEEPTDDVSNAGRNMDERSFLAYVRVVPSETSDTMTLRDTQWRTQREAGCDRKRQPDRLREQCSAAKVAVDDKSCEEVSTRHTLLSLSVYSPESIVLISGMPLPAAYEREDIISASTPRQQ